MCQNAALCGNGLKQYSYELWICCCLALDMKQILLPLYKYHYSYCTKQFIDLI